jgi:hypothetical protein
MTRDRARLSFSRTHEFYRFFLVSFGDHGSILTSVLQINAKVEGTGCPDGVTLDNLCGWTETTPPWRKSTLLFGDVVPSVIRMRSRL